MDTRHAIGRISDARQVIRVHVAILSPSCTFALILGEQFGEQLSIACLSRDPERGPSRYSSYSAR
jgi:hypothetical protein